MLIRSESNNSLEIDIILLLPKQSCCIKRKTSCTQHDNCRACFWEWKGGLGCFFWYLRQWNSSVVMFVSHAWVIDGLKDICTAILIWLNAGIDHYIVLQIADCHLVLKVSLTPVHCLDSWGLTTVIIWRLTCVEIAALSFCTALSVWHTGKCSS